MKLITLGRLSKILLSNAQIALNGTALACQALHVVLQVRHRLATEKIICRKGGYGLETMGNNKYTVYVCIYNVPSLVTKSFWLLSNRKVRNRLLGHSGSIARGLVLNIILYWIVNILHYIVL